MANNYDYAGALGISRLISQKKNPEQILASILGPDFLAYRQAWDQARTFQKIPPYPLHVDFEIKFKCPIRCPMCLMSLPAAERRQYGDETKELPPDLVIEIIREGAKQGQKSLGFGGLWEPLLCSDLPDIISAARAMGLLDIMFNTSGTFLNEDISKRLIKSGLTRLMISLDADTQEIYQKMRPGSDFKLVTENIKNFLALRRELKSSLPLVRLSFCQTAINEHELSAFIQRWENSVDFFSIQNYGRYPTPQAPGPAKNQTSPVTPGPCPQPQKRLLVRHNGDVVPCCDVSGLNLVLGNIYAVSNPMQSLLQFWQSDKLSLLRQNLQASPLPAICLNCQSKFA